MTPNRVASPLTTSHPRASTADDQANLQNRSRRFLKRAPGRYPVSLDPGVDALMTITTGEPPYLHVKEQHSHPDLFRRLLADTHAGKPVRGYYPISFNEREAHLSLLRAAYLVVFAVWGYQLILSPSYDRVRRQLQRIDETAISSLPVGVASASEKSVFMSYLPDLGAAIVVRFGDRWVALPKVGTDDEWWDRTDHAVTPGKTVDLPVLSRPGYPKFPLYLCDRQFDPSAATDWRPIERFGNPPST